ncbi:transposase [Zhenhengia yiwuensis]|uniref:transposase n=1 Tax=Zhenhengia yiwuensis TaxID=2763666 RepID=UPI002ED036DB
MDKQLLKTTGCCDLATDCKNSVVFVYRKSGLCEGVLMNMEFTETQLTKLTKKDIIGMCISLQQLVESLTTQCEKQQERFGSSTEKVDWEGQLEMLFNEDEVLIVDKYVVEPTLEQVCPELNNVTTKKRSPRPKGKREEDLAGLPIKIIEHTLCETELQEKFGST